MNYTQEDIKPFIDACETMAKSKFILVDKRIGDILKSIATTKPVYNAIAESMINFNWNSAWKIATARTGELNIPDEPSRLIAFVFCLLKNIDSGSVNINELLVKHFSNDEDRRSSYVVFCEKTIIPFHKYLVAKLCGEQPKAVEKEQVVMTVNTELNERLEFLVKDIKAYVIGIKKIKGCAVTKAEYLYIIENFLLAVKSKDEKYYALFTTLLDNFAGKDKELKNRIKAIIDITTHIKE